ncbi:winged helix-turn-helix domain-containing protein [Nocardia terpenica]|nr:winged helix-turn-helix domain-containing protein [Nocardia terpenica]MBF6103431.1 winged helix-turn-helix domain-containing protein [Nocardia terpenica]MBF6112195.1 winged helix-turn-helix domain-containing protein [Nocardia terpenica]MBF6117652.1 winged helix-turn-helix domain-containing protein [Nocardia terpenica]MBF6153604.1 winged helix-turn-helix domain-containing protein [Nocardia terpenica]
MWPCGWSGCDRIFGGEAVIDSAGDGAVAESGKAVGPAGHEAVRVGLLGVIAVGRGGELVALPGARARLLVAALAAHPGRSRSAQSLIDDVWGEQPPRAPMNALHTQVSRLRAALPEGALEIGPAGYRLGLREDEVDLTLARRLERQARELHAAGDHRGCVELVTRARGLWRGEPGADLPPGPVAAELADLAATRWHALDELESAAREAAGDLDGAVAIARRIVAGRPFDEPAHGVLMRLLAASGRGTEALDVFAALRGRLAAELGTDPGPALTALNLAILRGEPMTVDGRSAAPVGTERPARSEPIQKPAPAKEFEDSAHATSSAVGLRAAPNPLLGREADLAALTGSVRTARVTTVLGPGGTGKTRVANELGARAATERAVVLVELASLRADPDDIDGTRADIEAAISATLGVGEIGRDNAAVRRNRALDSRRRLRDALNTRPILLILDNCEHLVDAVADVVADLVGACDQLTVLTTSRSPLAITAETVYPLPPLAIDAHGSPATELFMARARAVRPSVRLDPEAVARLCRTLDGLPLAIELAAARVRTMSVEEIETRLEHRFALLRSGDRSSPERHRTLHAVIEWSWNLLDEPQRIALRRLCRFPAGFTLAAAESVAGGPEVGEVDAAVDGLVSQSMLTVLEDDDAGVVRYRMLETVREFGEERLAAAAEADAVMARMALWARDFALDAAGRYPTDEQVRVVLSVGTELDNLLAALRYAIDRGDGRTVYTVFPIVAALWMVRGAHAELVSWLPRILAVPQPVPRPDTIDAELQVLSCVIMCMHLFYSGDVHREIAAVRVRARRLLRSGVVLMPIARFAAEMVCTEPDFIRGARKLTAGTRSPDNLVRAVSLLVRANLRENMGDVRGSLRDSLRAMEMPVFEHVWGTAMLCQHLGQLASQTARYAESTEYYRRAVEAQLLLRAHDESVETRSFLAWSLIGAGEYDRAQRELEFAGRFVDGGAAPDDPVLRPNHRRAAVQAGWAELAFARGDVEVGLRRGRDTLALLAWPTDHPGPGPGDIMGACGVLDQHILYGRLDAVPDLPCQIMTVALGRLVQFWDLPQIGMVAAAIGSYLAAREQDPEISRELLVLAERTVARQDIPSMRLSRHLDLHRATLGEEELAAARRSVASLGRRRCADRIMTLLAEINTRMCE